MYAFEPQKGAFGKLTLQNNNSPYVRTFNFGLGAFKEEKELYKDSEGSEFGSIYPSEYFQLGVKLNLKEKIQLETLDEFCKTFHINYISLLKIDVEGHEIEVLKGAKEMIKARKIQFIQFEFGIASIESRIFMKDFFLLLNEYCIYRILPQGLQKINYSEYSELFLTTNYLAILI